MSFPIADSINLAPLTAAAGSYSPSLASLSTTTNDDHVFLAIACSATSGTLSVSGSGWSEVVELDVTSGQRMGIYVCKVAAGTVAAPTITLSAGTGLWGGMAWVERDADTTTPVSNSLGTGGGATATSLALGSFTPTNDDSRVVYFATGRVGTGSDYVRLLETAAVCDGYGSVTDGSIFLGMGLASVAQTTATDANVTAYYSNTGRVGIIAIAIKNKIGGKRARHATSGVTKLNWSGTFGANHDTGSWAIATSRTIDGIAVSATDPTRSVDVTGPSDIGSWDAIVTAVSTAGAWQGKKYTMTADTSFVGKMFSIEWLTGTPSVALGENGIIIVFEDNTEANWVAFKLSKKSGLVGSRLYTSVIDVKNATPYASGGTLDDANLFSVLRKISILVHRVGSSTANQTVTYRHMALIDKTTLVGGNSTRPLDINYLRNVLHGWGWQNIVGGESPAATLRSDVQIGDGSTATYYDATGTLHAFPDAYNENTQRSVNIPANQLDLTIKAGASDTILLTSTAVSAPTTNQQNFTIDAASSTSATYSLVGAAFIGLQWSKGISKDFSGASYSGCNLVELGGGTISSITVSDPSGTAALTESTSGATLSSSSIDVTGTSAAYHLELGTSVTAITLADVTFSGTPATDKVRVLATTGTVTITISGSTSLAAADVTSAGATVVISAPAIYQVVTITNLVIGSRVQIYDTTNNVELSNSVASGASVTWTDSVAYVADRDIRVRIAYVSGVTAKHFIEADIGTVGDGTPNSETLTYRANQTDDDVYVANGIDGSAVSGITFTDAATDIVNINVVSGSITYPQIYAATAYWLSTLAGITDDIAMVEAPDPANYKFTSMKIKNTGSGVLSITGGYGYDATTLSVADIIDTTGGFVFPLPDHVVSYATGSALTAGQAAQLSAIESATADIPTAVWSKTLPL